MGLHRDDFHTGIVTQFLENTLAIFPCESKCPHVSQTETRYCITYSVVVCRFKVVFHHGSIRPCHELIQGNLMVQIGCDLMRYSFTREWHSVILLNLLMTCVDRIFLMDFDKLILIVVNFLPEPYCILVRVDLFHVARFPTVSPCYLEPVPSTSAW